MSAAEPAVDPALTGSINNMFDPSAITNFRFVDRDFDPASGQVRLRYALDDVVQFEEIITVPLAADGHTHALPTAALDGALDLLHLTAGVSYFKAADPTLVDTGTLRMTAGLAQLATLLYGEGLAEFRVTNGRSVAAGPQFSANAKPLPANAEGLAIAKEGRVLVPVGGGKDSVVTIEALKAAGHELELFSVGDAAPITRTAEVAQLPRLVATRQLSPELLALNTRGALNGHVPVTAIVSSIAILVALLNGHSAVAMSNERSAGSGSFVLEGVDVNHQFSKGFVAEQAIALAAEELVGSVEYFSFLRPASELAIARAFAGMTQYHRAFTSCNAVFRIDPARRASHWCGDCPKCRFVWLILAPFMAPPELTEIFGKNMYGDENQFAGFAALLGVGEDKPFECVGTVDESIAALQLTADRADWDGHEMVSRLLQSVGTAHAGYPAAEFVLHGEHRVPKRFVTALEDALDAAQ